MDIALASVPNCRGRGIGAVCGGDGGLGGNVLITGVCWGNLYKCLIGQTLIKVMPNKVR